MFYTYQGGQPNKLTSGCGAVLGFSSSYQLVVFDIGSANSATGVAAYITAWIAAARGLLKLKCKFCLLANITNGKKS